MRLHPFSHLPVLYFIDGWMQQTAEQHLQLLLASMETADAQHSLKDNFYTDSW